MNNQYKEFGISDKVIWKITIPDESSKVGDDLYNYTLESAKEKIEKYIKNNKVEKAEENK